jgi:cbb3-type cytochrome c oxidase subunit III
MLDDYRVVSEKIMNLHMIMVLGVVLVATGCAEKEQAVSQPADETPVTVTAAEAKAVDHAAGKRLYTPCAACHGINAEGIVALNSPALAGQSESYLIRQLWDFKKGNRGAADGDIIGAQMRPMAMMLEDGVAIANVAAYLASLPTSNPPATVEGDAANGKKLYDSRCGACHGGKGWGIEALHTPNLSSIGDSYLMRQVQNFQNGLRGAKQDAVEGKQMAMMAKSVTTEELKDIAAFLNAPEPQE